MITLKALVRSYIAEVWTKGNLDAVDIFLSPDYRRHLSPTAEPLLLDGQKQRITAFRSAFPDIRITIEDVLSEDNYVIFRSSMQGTHQGVFQGIQPTGKTITVSLIDIIRVEHGKFIEHWGGPDLFDLLKQLGAEFSIP
ncbi:MAG TPA: ester cyclase [Anaerolineales bacterium]|nr:ester cyclase [Anaerolineales bacterium]